MTCSDDRKQPLALPANTPSSNFVNWQSGLTFLAESNLSDAATPDKIVTATNSLTVIRFDDTGERAEFFLNADWDFAAVQVI